VFSVVKLFVHRRPLIVVALAAIAVVNAYFGHPTVGMWDGPL
jgi:hypothetical protein